MKKKTKKKDEENLITPKSFHWRDLLTNKFVDLIIVITGVTIAFQLNNWKLNSDQKSLEAFYKESLSREVNKDIDEEEGIIKALRHDLILTEAYLKSQNPSPDSLARAIVEVLSLETFGGNQNTYQTLLQGNALSVISDQQLRNQITEYYSGYTSIRRFEDVYTSVLFKTYDYFSLHCDFERSKLTDPSIQNKIQTRNSLIIILSQLNDGIKAHRRALERARALTSGL